jgi:CRP-like cAMP-binding protein
MAVPITTELLDLLGHAPLFEGAGLVERQAALRVATHCRLEKGAFFFHQEETAVAFYIVLSGRVRLTQITPEGHQVIIRFLGPGEGMGIIVVLSNTIYPLSAEVSTDCTALKWNYDAAVKLMEDFPQLALNGLRLVAGRFHELQNRYRELATQRVERRVAHTLLRLARQTGKRNEQGILLDLPLSRQDLGEMTGTTLYTVSRILSKWEQEGLIQTGREQVTIVNPHQLVIISEDIQ